MGWFDVDRSGLAAILERRGKAFAIFELPANVPFPTPKPDAAAAMQEMLADRCPLYGQKKPTV